MRLIPNQSKPEIKFDFSKKIFIKEGVLDHALCDRLVQYGENNVTKGVNKYPRMFSISFHSCLLPIDAEAHFALQDSWKEAIDFLKFDIDFIEPYELKRYTPNDFFGKHVDNYYSLTEDVDRKITMSVQLTHSDEYTDGELVVFDTKFKSTKGSVICFPSYFPHGVEKVTSGTRWSLIGWAWGPYWK